jgi:hypothetical protein
MCPVIVNPSAKAKRTVSENIKPFDFPLWVTTFMGVPPLSMIGIVVENDSTAGFAALHPQCPPRVGPHMELVFS